MTRASNALRRGRVLSFSYFPFSPSNILSTYTYLFSPANNIVIPRDVKTISLGGTKKKRKRSTHNCLMPFRE